MRQGQQNRRGRGRGTNNNNNNNSSSHTHTHSNNPNNNRKPQNSLSRSYESSGPDVKIRGTAAQIAEKYITLARDASSAGDTVQAENYLQHAEHYNRIIMAAQAQVQAQPLPVAPGAYQPAENIHGLNGNHRPHMDGNGVMRDQPQPRIPQHQAPQPTIQPVESSEPDDDEQPSLPVAARESAQPVIAESPKEEAKEETAAAEPDARRPRRRRYPAGAAANGTSRAASAEASNGNGKAIDVPDDGRSTDEALA